MFLRMGFVIMSFLLSLNFLQGAAQAQDVSARKVVEDVIKNYYYAGDNGKAKVTMTIYDKRGNKRMRVMHMLRMDNEDLGEQKYYAYFVDPADIRGTVFMVWKHLDKDDDRWLYVPAIDLTKRISTKDKRSSFVGSNFTYEDVSGRNIDLDEYAFEEGAPEGTYVIRMTPKDKDVVEFGYRIMYVDADTLMPQKIEHFDKKGKLYRTIEIKKVENIGGYLTATEAVAKDEDGSYTEYKVEGIDYDVEGIDDNLFTERYLRKPPRMVLE